MLVNGWYLSLICQSFFFLDNHYSLFGTEIFKKIKVFNMNCYFDLMEFEGRVICYPKHYFGTSSNGPMEMNPSQYMRHRRCRFDSRAGEVL